MADTGSSDDVARIRTLIEDRVHAVHAKNSAMLLPAIASDIVSFDVVSPLHNDGSEALRERVEAWFAGYDGPIGYEVRDLHITAGDEVAFCRYFYRVSGTMTNGAQVNMWVRATACYRKLDGTWTTTHVHESVPFDPESGNALLDLEP